ncbi:MAG: hypothetical protein M1412_08310 [Deltaproteobacteria bacterium]|nr:hypothetical protein [Deltaproteobacteria bacterium]MCL5893145.1 hypothetical protein [Deltaproteobacteria bacterium]
MEELKRFEDLCEYDDNFKTNNDLKNYYNKIKEINLNKNVPKQIKIICKDELLESMAILDNVLTELKM